MSYYDFTELIPTGCYICRQGNWQPMDCGYIGPNFEPCANAWIHQALPQELLRGDMPLNLTVPTREIIFADKQRQRNNAHV